MWVIQFLFLALIFFGSWAIADEIKETQPSQDELSETVEKTSKNEVKVIFDITRGVQKAKIIKNGVVVSEHKISGAKNRAIVVSVKGRRQKFCAFTTTGTNIKPTHIYRSYYSREHKVDLAHFATFDYDRGIGAHQGDTSGYSSGCVRQTAKGAKAVYDIVMENSEVKKGSVKIQSTDVTFDIIDNTPGRYSEECDCLKSHMGDTTSPRAQRVCALAGKETGSDEKPSISTKRPKKRPAKVEKTSEAFANTTGGLY